MILLSYWQKKKHHSNSMTPAIVVMVKPTMRIPRDSVPLFTGVTN